MKLKNIVLTAGLSFAVLGLTACGNNDLADPSPAQEKAAQAVYDELRQAKFDQLDQYFDPKLQHYFAENSKEVKKFSAKLPKEAYKHKRIIVKKMQQDKTQTELYTVSYEYGYAKNLVQYDVSFDKPGGSPAIHNLNVQVFGEKVN